MVVDMTYDGYRTRAAKLAAAARALQASGGVAATFNLAFLTDLRRVAHPELVARALPPGAAIVYRDYCDPRRAAHGAMLRAIAASRGVLFFVGGDAALARRLGADGVHLRAADLPRVNASAFIGLRVSAACHTDKDLRLASEIGADVAFLSPVYETASHAGAPGLGAKAFRTIAAAAPLPALALGGIDEANAGALRGRNVCGFGAIGAFAPRGL